MRELQQKDTTPQHEASSAQADDGGALIAAHAPASAANTYTLFGVKRAWSIVAALCLVVAGVLGWRGHYDGMFVVATLGVVAWFIDQRNLLRARSIEADIAEDDFASEEDEQ